MADMELQKDANGEYVMRPADFRLHVDTGEEASQQWPSAQVDEVVMPLLEMPQAWQMIVDEEELPAKKKPQGEFLEVNAKIMVKEISYHLMASTALPPKEGASDDGEQGKSDVKETVGGEEEQNREGVDVAKKAESGDEDLKDSKGKSIYGASLLLKLQWEDKTPQKAVPHRSCEELGNFIHQLTTDLLDAKRKNQKAGQAVLDTLAFELTLLLLARYMEGIETGVKVLEDSAYELLHVCAGHANPKEMCMPLRTLGRKIDVVYADATFYLILEPLLKLWTKLVLRIPRKRNYFLNDLIKAADRMLKDAEAYEMHNVDDDSQGVAKPGRISHVWDILLEFLEELTKLQLKHRDTSNAIRLKVDDLGRQRPDVPTKEVEVLKSDEGRAVTDDTDGKDEGSSVTESEKTSSENKEGEPEQAGEGKKKEPDAVAIDAETKDWVNERATTLARLLIMQGTVWNNLQEPEGDERESPYRKSKRAGKHARSKPMDLDKNEHDLLRCHRLFKDLGWSNPVLVSQLVGGELNLDPWSRAEELFREHIKHDVRSKKERKGTLFSMNSVGLYLCGVLRPRTSRLLEGKSCDGVDEYAVDLNGSGFDLLEPFYALDLVLPYVMTLIPDSTKTRSLGAIFVTNAFLKRIPDGGFETFDEVMMMRCSANAIGREVNLPGLCQHLVKAVAGCDDPRHRRVAYETFQLALRKVRDPHARYTIVECVLHDCSRVAVAAQLVTEMKDAIRYSDLCAEQGGSNWSDAQASSLKTRFVEVILPTYFTPRKEMLMNVNAMVAVAGVVVWLGGSDKRLLERLAEGNKLRESVEKRMKFVKEHCKLGRECIRALASVAEHDRKNMPTSQLAKTNRSEAEALFAASGRTLNHCMNALSLLTVAEPFFESVPIAS